MFDVDPFAKREKALEDEFFHRVDEKLRENLRRSMERDAAKAEITAATGFQDQALIDELLDAGIEATTLVALALVPSVFVAWADGNVTEAERAEVLKAASERGIGEEHVARKLLDGWLQSKPPKSLWETWKHYASAAGNTLTDQVSGKLTEEIVTQATWVAKASGGVLGLGKISPEEQKVLNDVRQALS